MRHVCCSSFFACWFFAFLSLHPQLCSRFGRFFSCAEKTLRQKSLFGTFYSRPAWTFVAFFATKAAIFAAFFVTIVVLTAQMLLRERKKRSGDEIEIFVDHLIMSMRAGISFEMALRESVQGHPHRLILFNNHHTYGQLLAHCRDNPSQSYKLLEVFRQTTRLRNKLHAKHRTLSLQAKAQGLIGVALFIVIFVFQWLMIPDFRNFLRASSGRFVVILCAFLIFLGTRWIFKIGKPPEFQL